KRSRSPRIGTAGPLSIDFVLEYKLPITLRSRDRIAHCVMRTMIRNPECAAHPRKVLLGERPGFVVHISNIIQVIDHGHRVPVAEKEGVITQLPEPRVQEAVLERKIMRQWNNFLAVGQPELLEPF